MEPKSGPYETNINQIKNSFNMKKICYYGFAIGCVLSAIICIYSFFTFQLELALAAFFVSIFSGLCGIVVEPRPRDTEDQRNHDDKLQVGGLSLLTVITISLILTILVSSCGTRNGYGCHGNQSWGKMIKRNNRPY